MTLARPIEDVRTIPAATAPAVTGGRRRHFRRPLPLYVAAVAILLSLAGMMGFVFFATRLVVMHDPLDGWWALGCMSAFVCFKGLSSILAHSLRCQLCHGAALKDRGCHKHSEAKKLPLLSHRLTVALAIVFTLGFHCMYCGTGYRLRK